ncbi:right-handed parallel beta-helix repeat-containing protein [Actinomadura hibisca]|uniref:right-handed parallel beta-helix repeat-containing protein n=1 Tax=Actinomadura hibisca TaxID=68565 RepID=UPI00082F55F3|nr:right-handed parallel beta-helix repeat-containing protein [Actinomadura hibisca]
MIGETIVELGRRDAVRVGIAAGAALLGGGLVPSARAASATRRAAGTVNPYPAGEDGTVVALRHALDDAANGIAGLAGRDDKGRIIVRAKAAHRHVLRANLIVPGNTHLDATDARFVADFVSSGTAKTMVLNHVPGATTGGYNAPGNIRITGGSWDPVWQYLQNGTTAPAMNGITMEHTSNVELVGVTMYNVKWWHAIELNAVRNATVQECKLFGWIVDPQYVDKLWHGEAVQLDLAGSANTWAGAKDNTPCTDIRIIGNECAQSGSQGAWGALTGSHTAVPNVRHSRVRIEDNTVTGSLWDAITPFNTEALAITGNRITDCHGGVYVRGANSGVNPLTTVDITGNTVGPLRPNAQGKVRTGIGIAAYTADAPIRDILVTGNTAPSFSYYDQRWMTFRQPPQTK